MPESEPKPRLIELVAPGQGQGWKAVLKNGKPAVIHEIPIPAAEAAAAIPRIQRLADHRHPALSPVLAWGTDPMGSGSRSSPTEARRPARGRRRDGRLRSHRDSRHRKR